MVQRRCATWFYHGRISGPLIDRFDIHIEVPRVDYEKLTSDRLVPQAAQRADPGARRPQAPSKVEGCGTRRAAGALSRDQDGVQRGHGAGRGARALRGGRRRQVAAARGDAAVADERAGVCRFQTIDRILKLARTIADLANSARIEAPHVAEAIQYRPRRML